MTTPKRKMTILTPISNNRVEVPASCQRLCAQCLEPMPLDYYHWENETTVHLIYLCQHSNTSRFKRVAATLDRKGRLNDK